MPFSINPAVAAEPLRETFCAQRRAHITEFLQPEDAQSMYHALVAQRQWSYYCVEGGRIYAITPEPGDPPTAEQERELIEQAYESARQGGPAFFYEACSMVVDTADVDNYKLAALPQAHEFLQSDPFLEFLRQLTGISELTRIEVEALRLRPGFFKTFHDAVLPTDDAARKRRGGFVLHLTPEWRPEWGGLLEFRNGAGYLIDAYVPCFNCLDVFAVPQGYWWSVVAPFAGEASYCFSGSYFVS